MLSYIGPEFVEMLRKPGSVAETSSNDEPLVQIVPDNRKAPEVLYGRLQLALLKLFIITFQLATRWLL